MTWTKAQSPIDMQDGAVVLVSWEVTDYTDKHGHVYSDGAHIVRAERIEDYYDDPQLPKAWRGRTYKGRSRMFYGDHAWSRAEALFRDIVTELLYDHGGRVPLT